MFQTVDVNFMQSLGDIVEVVLMLLRLINLVVLVSLLIIHVRSVRVFRWEQTVSGGLLVTYVVAVVGLALCAGIEKCGAKALQLGVWSSNGMALLSFAVILVIITIHFRSLVLFRLTQSASGIGTLNVAFIIGLAICVGTKHCGFLGLRAYLGGAGAVLLIMNAVTIWRRWRGAGDMTRVVAELLGALGVPLRRQILIKAILSAIAAILMLIDFIWIMMMPSSKAPSQ